MRLIDADTESLTVELTTADQRILGGMLAIIAACPRPIWEDSTGDSIDALTPAQFTALRDAWLKLTAAHPPA